MTGKGCSAGEVINKFEGFGVGREIWRREKIKRGGMDWTLEGSGN